MHFEQETRQSGRALHISIDMFLNQQFVVEYSKLQHPNHTKYSGSPWPKDNNFFSLRIYLIFKLFTGQMSHIYPV